MNKNTPIIIILCAFLSSCVHINKELAGGVGGQDIQSNEANDGKITLITRDYLTPSKKEYPFYKFYSYLIFIDKSSSTLEMREAASEAYLCQFISRGEAETIQLNLDDLAVFYAPLRNDVSTNTLNNSTSVSSFLSEYSYGYAQALVSTLDDVIGKDEFLIGIIASPQPLYMGNNSIPTDQIQVLNLTDTPPAQIKVAIKRYRQLITGNYVKRDVDIILDLDPITGNPEKIEKRKIPVLDPITKIDMATKVRSVFYSIGKMLTPKEALASNDKKCI